MSKLSAKNKIILIAILWLALTGSMFLSFFNILDNSNQTTVAAISGQQKNLAVLTAERNSFVQGQQDLQKMQSQQYQPADFFSRDVTLVGEIEALEQWAQTLNLQMQLSGLSGTASQAPKVPATAGNIVAVPYNITLAGPLTAVVQYLQVLENLDFITNVSSISLSAAGPNTVNANLSADFYLRLQ